MEQRLKMDADSVVCGKTRSAWVTVEHIANKYTSLKTLTSWVAVRSRVAADSPALAVLRRAHARRSHPRRRHTQPPPRSGLCVWRDIVIACSARAVSVRE